MFEQTFKNIDNILWKDPGCSTELHYVEQTSWILFLKYLHDLEKDRQDIAELTAQRLLRLRCIRETGVYCSLPGECTARRGL